jgi:hypothetical protein
MNEIKEKKILYNVAYIKNLIKNIFFKKKSIYIHLKKKLTNESYQPL